MPSTFSQATAVVPVDQNTYRADIPPEWNVPIGIHGGVLMATTLRAAVERLDDPGLRLRTAHGSFYARPTSNRLLIETDEVRRGGTTAHIRSESRSEDQEHTALATRSLFTRDRDGESHLDDTPPDVEAPQDCPEDGTGDDESPLSRPPLFGRLDMRRAQGSYPWHADWSAGLPMTYARWSHYHDRPSRPDGSFDPLALLPLADLPGPAVWVHYSPDEPVQLLISLELTLHLLEPVRDDWILASFKARWLGDGYAFTECDLWSAGRLVAQSSQSMMLRVAPAGI